MQLGLPWRITILENKNNDQKKNFISIIAFVTVSSCLIFYIANRAISITETTTGLKIATLSSDTTAQVIIMVDSLNNIYMSEHRISITNIQTILYSANNKAQKLILVPHPDCNVDTLKKVANIAINMGLTVHIRHFDKNRETPWALFFAECPAKHSALSIVRLFKSLSIARVLFERHFEEARAQDQL